MTIFRNNSEIYLASIAARPEFGSATVLNAASQGREPEKNTQIAPGSIATIRGSALAFKTEAATFTGGDPPFTVAGTTVKVNGQRGANLLCVPGRSCIRRSERTGEWSGGVCRHQLRWFFVESSRRLSPQPRPEYLPLAGDGRGEAIILNSDTLTTAPFDPSSGQLRLSIFATGAAQAKNVSVTIKGKPVDVETVAAASLTGLDEIHVLVPPELSGAGTSTLIVTADGVQSNSVSVVTRRNCPRHHQSTPTPTHRRHSPSPDSDAESNAESDRQLQVHRLIHRHRSSSVRSLVAVETPARLFETTLSRSSTAALRQLISPDGPCSMQAQPLRRGQ